MADNEPIVETDIEDVSLIDTPIAQPTDATSGKPAEQGKDDAAATDDDKPADQPKDGDADDKPATGTDDKPADQQNQQQQLTPEQEKAERDRIARDSYIQRQRTRQQVERQLDEAYGPKTAEQLQQDDGLSPEDARYEAFRQEVAYKEQRAQIAELNAGMQAEAVNALNDFKVFDPNSKDYDESFTNEVQSAYQKAARLQFDENGIVTNAETPLYDFYKQMAGIYSRGQAQGTQQGQQEMQQMLARTEDSLGGSSTTNKGEETLADLEERLGDTVIT